jgi:hypothetical protein
MEPDVFACFSHQQHDVVQLRNLKRNALVCP